MSEPLWRTCDLCMMHLWDTPHLTAAFASVGIEAGKSAYQMAQEYFTAYHRKNHPKEWNR